MTKLTDNAAEARTKALDDLFADAPLESEVLVDLPSKGKFYKGYTGLKVSPLLFEDEQRILASKSKGINPVNEILSKCVTGVNISELLPMDKLFILLKIKEISYGKDYKFSVTCSNCGHISDATIDVTQIPVNFILDDLTDPREIYLPVLRKNAVVRFPRNFESHYFNEVDIALQNLYRFVVSIDGNEDPIFISAAIKRLHMKDSKTLVAAIHKAEFGIDPTFEFECGSCHHKEALGVPFDANFFSVS